MGSCLSVIADQFNNNPEFDFTVHLRVEEADVLRGGPLHDLFSSARRKDYLMDIRSGRHAATIIAPPCETHTRARHANRNGPPPLRSHAWPRGLPNLTPAQQEQVRRSNLLADFAIEAFETAVQSGVLAVLEFPEDLGPARLGHPASLWQSARLQGLKEAGAVRGAIYQDAFDKLSYLKPTGLITTIPLLIDDARFH